MALYRVLYASPFNALSLTRSAPLTVASGDYEEVATVKADSLEHLYRLMNVVNGNELPVALGRRSMSTGDVAVDEAGQAHYCCAYGWAPTRLHSLAVPTIHLNGSSADELLLLNREAADALRKAQEALARATPHGRDYYPQVAAGAWLRAMREHEARAEKLRSVAADLEVLAMSILDQKEARRR